MAVETERVSKLNSAGDRPDAEYVLYWAQMNRRVDANHGCYMRLSLPIDTGCPSCITKA